MLLASSCRNCSSVEVEVEENALAPGNPASPSEDRLATHRTVTVTVTVHDTTQILSAFGLTQINGTATATATELHGTSTGGS